ncbi:glutathione peroxidase [Parapedobacter defluvii]|uniref:Glutathione peroxidase n=1 Tax=Parapedobacter defluvii TaxID=2045106 RepID=A0ABQ1M6C2_9SPHI|nr:glutathione peroxidase [Parapedobacter defluvii]RQP17427.1 MAG: glutathione peroxidase [Parapedobacter sp.]GGC34114.1 glutathione peroxidase [Parapedobacter defluvii]
MKSLFLVLAAVLMVNPAENVYQFSITSIDGKKVDLSQFKGKKLLIVNTASKCGYTKQYAGLQELSEKYADKVVVIGFPANNFGGQEPGSNDEIQGFCEKNFGVTFLLAEKSSVAGEDISPLFKYLTEMENPDFTGEIKWNFEKFLIDEQGNLIHRFRSKIEPMSAELTGKL